MKIGTYENLITDYKSVTDYTCNGHCSNCGNCCSNNLPLSKTEIKTIRHYIKQHNLHANVCHYPTATPVIDMTCPFRNNDTKQCDIYNIRPEICRTFTCNQSIDIIESNKQRLHTLNNQINMRQTFFNN